MSKLILLTLFALCAGCVPAEVRVEAPSLDRFGYDNGVLELGDRRLYLMTPAYTELVKGRIKAGRAELVSGSRIFAFGPAQPLPSISGMPKFEFTPDPGDRISFTIERSLLSWPTLFETSFMSGVTPRWRRRAYCRLHWTKRSGASLKMLWRVGQAYYTEGGWRPEPILVITDGLVRTDIDEPADLERAAVQYLTLHKHWDRAEYRLEYRGPSSDGAEEIVFALHRDDEHSPAPSSGRSVELRVNYQSRQVAREIGGQ